MKKIIICIVALLISAPAAAGWKEDILNEFSAMMRDLDKAMKAQGLPSDSQSNIAYGAFSAMSGMCVGFSRESGKPVPNPAIKEILRVHKIILQGKTPKNKSLRNIGKLCLNYMEDTLRKDGISDEEIALAGDVMVKVLVPRLRASMGLPPKQ